MEKRDLDAIKAATSAGVKDAVSDPETWRVGIVAMQAAVASAAQRESGKWVIGWLGWLLKKAALSLAVIGALYYTGGLAAVVAWLKVK